MPTDRTPVNTAEWRWALIRSDLPPAARHVALTLSVRMDADGTIPSKYKIGVRRIATDAGAHRNTVMPAVRILIAAGYLEETEPAVGTRPARYRAAVPQRHSDWATSDGEEDPRAAQPLGHYDSPDPVDNGSIPGDIPVEKGEMAEGLWHNAEPLVAQQTAASGTTTGPHPALPAHTSTSSSDMSASGQGRRPSLDDLERIDRLGYLRRAHDDLVDRGIPDPAIDVIHARAQTLLEHTTAKAQA